MTVTRGIKKSKTAPASANKVRLVVEDEYTVYWKGRARPRRRGALKPSRPRPKKWASLVVFLHDVTKRKRSYHVAWNGQRFNDTPDAFALQARERPIYRAVKASLSRCNDRLIKGWTDDY